MKNVRFWSYSQSHCGNSVEYQVVVVSDVKMTLTSEKGTAKHK